MKIKLMKYRIILFFSLIFLFIPIHSKGQPLRVARIFSDNMVLQQNIYAPIWGWAKPGEKVTVDINEKKYSTITNTEGKWMLRLNPMQSGGDFVLTVSTDSEKIEFRNVLIGEVWLASGQSNMNFKLGRVDSAEKVIKEANYPNIREFETPYDVSRTPLEDLSGGEWKICTPETVGSFSGVAYFFARSLHIDQNVPVGIIHTSWSGTPCQSWISADMLYTMPEFKDKIIKEIYENDSDWSELQSLGNEKNRLREEIFQSKCEGLKKGVHKYNFNDKEWKESNYPLTPSQLGLPGYKLVWFRKEINLSGKNLKNDLILHLGKVMTGDVTYFNGVELGRERWDGVRNYRIPAKLLKKGKNVIAIRLLSEWGNGRLGDKASDPFLYNEDKSINISLKNEWKYNGDLEPELPVGQGYSNNPSSMFNTKISPLLPYGLSGFLWYQGEGNAGNPNLYSKLQPMLINDWRVRFEQGYLPFLFVQLPNLDGASWAEFREVQSRSLDLPNVGMAVSIDVGNPFDIHPNNKKPVGERLYLQAKNILYGDADNIVQGPVYKSCELENTKVRIKFASVGNGLISIDNKPLRSFEIAGEDGKFYPAIAEIEGSDVVLWCESVSNPKTIRHAWSGNPNVNLYNEKKLPATSFRANVVIGK